MTDDMSDDARERKERAGRRDLQPFSKWICTTQRARERSRVGTILRVIDNPRAGQKKMKTVGRGHKKRIVELEEIEERELVVYQTASAGGIRRVNRIGVEEFLEKYRLVARAARYGVVSMERKDITGVRDIPT